MLNLDTSYICAPTLRQVSQSHKGGENIPDAGTNHSLSPPVAREGVLCYKNLTTRPSSPRTGYKFLPKWLTREAAIGSRAGLTREAAASSAHVRRQADDARAGGRSKLCAAAMTTPAPNTHSTVVAPTPRTSAPAADPTAASDGWLVTLDRWLTAVPAAGGDVMTWWLVTLDGRVVGDLRQVVNSGTCRRRAAGAYAPARRYPPPASALSASQAFMERHRWCPPEPACCKQPPV
eukprot:4069337-Pyramimonas_sp.AAC.1